MDTANEMIDKCSERLKALNASLTPDDRKEAQTHFNVCYHTIHRYVKNGEVKNLDLGVKLYEFLNARIEARKAALA